MSIWGTTDDWAGTGPHASDHLGRERCCENREMRIVQGGRDGGDMLMIDSDNGDLLETWQCTECHRVWFRRPGMTGFFSVRPCVPDPFRGRR